MCRGMPPCCCGRRRNKPRNYRLKTQLANIIIATMEGLNAGMSISHAAVLIPQIQAENGTLQVNEDTATWIASVYSFASPAGCLLGGVASEMFGRVLPVLFAFVTMSIGWLMIALSQDIELIIVGRCLEGICKSIALTASTVLVDETLYPTFRGFIFIHYGTMVSMGIFTMMGLSNLMSWRSSSMVAFGVSVVSSVLVVLLTESPMWLVRKGRIKKAERALNRIWGPSRHQKAREVLQNLVTLYADNRESSSSVFSRFNKILTPGVLKPFFIIHIINLLKYLLCGNHLVINYSVDIASRMSQDHDPYVINTILAVVRTVVCFVAALSMAYVGRRTFMMFSGVGCTLSCLALAGVLFFDVADRNLQENLSIVLLGVYVAFFTSGYFLVPTVVIGEMLPAAVRSYLCGYIYTVNDLTGGGVLKLYPWLLRTFDLHGMFLMFGVSCAFCALFVYLLLPETNGKTLEEIEEYFKQDNILWITRKTATPVDVSETDELCEDAVSSKV